MISVAQESVDEVGGGGAEKLVQITGDRGPGRGLRFGYVAYIFTFLGSIISCRFYKLTFQNKCKLLSNWESRQGILSFLVSPPLLVEGGGSKKLFHRRLNPLSAALVHDKAYWRGCVNTVMNRQFLYKAKNCVIR